MTLKFNFFFFCIVVILLANTVIVQQTKAEDLNMKIISKDIVNQKTLDKEFTCEGSDLSPEISWEGIPANAQTLALIVDDPDAPMSTWVHWIVYNIPVDMKGFERGIAKSKLDSKGIVQGITSFGNKQYGGPCPPKGHGPHRYFFKLYALDVKLDIGNRADKGDLEDAMEGHILAKAELIGNYERR